MSDDLVIISDFNADPLVRLLKLRADEPVVATPFNQVYQSLETADAGKCGIIWTRAESVLPSFARALELGVADHEKCLEEVGAFAQFVRKFAARGRHCLMATWTLPPGTRGYGMLDWRPGLGLANLVARINLELAEQLSELKNVHLLDASHWQSSSPAPFAARMWFAAKVPYVTGVFEAAAADIHSALIALAGKSRKLIVVDLDNTMWGGIVGEMGPMNVRLGGHDHVGEAFVAFQRELKALSNRGIQIGVVSKNDESVALEAIDQHPEMLLRSRDLAGWRINWGDKAANIAALVEDLNLGLGSVVFIDDNPHERERVRTALPEVLVPDWPRDACDYATALRALQCFNAPAISGEDRQRTAMYVAERGRRQSRSTVPAIGDWLQGLGTVVTVAPVGKENLARAAQLLNKTNQLNMATRRLSERELLEWSAAPNRSTLAISVADKFGDLGLCGLLSVAVDGHEAQLADYLLSCRVMGRGVEETMFHLAARQAAALGARKLTAAYLPTERNRPCLQVLQESRLVAEGDHLFRWNLEDAYEHPVHVTIREVAPSGAAAA